MSPNLWILFFCLELVYCQVESGDEIYARQKDDPWFKDGIKLIKSNLKQKNINKKAKGVILVIGDGMGISTITAGRILDGQLKGGTGEENVLNWEDPENFPNVALSKTYNTDRQTADSAGTATAYLSGVKTVSGVIGIDRNSERKKCASSLDTKVLSIIMLAEQAGLSTGIVTTTRITHATPSAMYAHSADRSWEGDANLPAGTKCKDIASQLIDFPYGNGPEVVFGGGRMYFLPNTTQDPEENTKNGTRQDGRDLIQEWKSKSSQHVYVWNQKQFDKIDVTKVSNILGLFAYSHMQFSYERENDTAGEPTLTEMVEVALKKLQQNEKGYVLLVEGGRIDHGHHANKAFLALHDVVSLNKAVGKAVEMTDPSETLIIVSADHSHVFTIGGYQSRGNPVFSLTNREKSIANDRKAYSTLGYINGPGATVNKERQNVSEEELKNPNHLWQSLVPLASETHGAEDVGIYARGTQAHLVRGVVEQNYIFHVMDYALCLSESKKEICRNEGLINRSANEASHLSVSFLFVLSILVAISLT